MCAPGGGSADPQSRTAGVQIAAREKALVGGKANHWKPPAFKQVCIIIDHKTMAWLHILYNNIIDDKTMAWLHMLYNNNSPLVKVFLISYKYMYMYMPMP